MRKLLLIILAALLALTPRPSTADSDVLFAAFEGARLENEGEQAMSGGPVDIATIEQRLSAWREAGARTEDGYPKSWHFYTGIRQMIVMRSDIREIATAWQRRFPDSPSGFVLEGMYRLYSTTKAAMSGLALMVTAFDTTADTTGFGVDRAAVEAARDYLESVKAQASADPHWYVLMAEIGLTLGQDPDSFFTLLQEGLQRHKDPVLIDIGASYALPKWHGDAKALEFFARTAHENLGKDGIEGSYARSYLRAFKAQYQYDLFKRSQADWPTLHKSLEDLLRSSWSVRNQNVAIMMACMAGDQETTRRFSANPPPFLADVWQGRQYYATCLDWARPALPAGRSVGLMAAVLSLVDLVVSWLHELFDQNAS